VVVVSVRRATVLREGFQYLEGFRWHAGEVWFSDIPQDKVYRLRPYHPRLRTTVALHEPIHPSGLGFPPSGRPLVVGQGDETLRAINANGTSEVVADLSQVAVGANDMWVTPEGRAYITQVGFDVFGGDDPVPSQIIIVHPDGTIETAGEDLWAANGIQVNSDGTELITAETFGQRLTVFDIGSDGRLSNQRVLKQFDDPFLDIVDGLVIDAEDAIWVAVPFSGEVRRVTRDGEVTDVVKTAEDGYVAITCTLGGTRGSTLYIAATRERDIPDLLMGPSRVESIEVDVPGLV
jgi:sugar lactone lactonase YvrE